MQLVLGVTVKRHIADLIRSSRPAALIGIAGNGLFGL